MSVPGVGPVLASAMIALVPDPGAFHCGRNLAAWIGLVPRQNSSGGKERLGGISKQGNRYLRQMLVVGAMAVIRYAQLHVALVFHTVCSRKAPSATQTVPIVDSCASQRQPLALAVLCS